MHRFTELAECSGLAAECVRQQGQTLGNLRVARHYCFAQVIEIGLAAIIQQGGQQGDADRAAQIT